MRGFLRQSTAGTYKSFAFLDKADGFTGKTALASQVGRLTKNGAAGAAFTPAAWTHEYGGAYRVGFASGDVDTLGYATFAFYDPAIHMGVEDTFVVLAPEEYDLLFGAPTEVAAVPAIGSRIGKILGWLFVAARNKRTGTGLLEKIRNDADSADIGSASLLSDGTTTTRGKWS